jgi:hypothetical protein
MSVADEHVETVSWESDDDVSSALESGSFWAPANLVFKALHPLMAAMVQMCALG